MNKRLRRWFRPKYDARCRAAAEDMMSDMVGTPLLKIDDPKCRHVLWRRTRNLRKNLHICSLTDEVCGKELGEECQIYNRLTRT